MFPNNNKPPFYGGLGVDFDAESGSRDGHCLNIFYTTYNPIEMTYQDGGEPPQDRGQRIIRDDSDGTYIFQYLQYQDRINDFFNTKFGDQMCFYIYDSNSNDIGMKSTSDRNNPNKYLYTSARVWLKSIDGWAIFSTPMEKLEYVNNPWNFIKRYLFKNYNTVIYCFSDSISCGIAKIATPDNTNYIYNNKYSLSSPLTINCTVSNTNVTFGNNIQCSNGQQNLKNIEFKKENGNNSLEKSIDYNIEITSSENFQDKVSDMIENEQNLHNIYINTGQSLDADGIELNSNKFYFVQEYNNKLRKEYTISNNIQINKNLPYNDGVYGILWRGTQILSPQLRYDVTGWDGKDHWTLFDYTGIKTISI